MSRNSLPGRAHSGRLTAHSSFLDTTLPAFLAWSLPSQGYTENNVLLLQGHQEASQGQG